MVTRCVFINPVTTDVMLTVERTTPRDCIIQVEQVVRELWRNKVQFQIRYFAETTELTIQGFAYLQAMMQEILTDINTARIRATLEVPPHLVCWLPAMATPEEPG